MFIVRSFGLEGDSNGFSVKLVGMQVICRTNTQTAPGYIYGISARATSVMWRSNIRLGEMQRVPMGS